MLHVCCRRYYSSQHRLQYQLPHKCTRFWVFWHICCLAGARNHHYFILFLLSLMLMGAWMFYGCLMCEWLDMQCNDSIWHSFTFTLDTRACAAYVFQTGRFTVCCVTRSRACGAWSLPSSAALPGCSASSCWPSITPAGPAWSCWCSSTRWLAAWRLSTTFYGSQKILWTVFLVLKTRLKMKRVIRTIFPYKLNRFVLSYKRL